MRIPYAIFVACLGLYGLTTFSTQQRIKEIAIRKTIGASVSSIIFILCEEYTKLIIISIVVACPVSWFVMKNWLQNFAYHTDIGLSIFLYSGLLVLFSGLLLISGAVNGSIFLMMALVFGVITGGVGIYLTIKIAMEVTLFNFLLYMCLPFILYLNLAQGDFILKKSWVEKNLPQKFKESEICSGDRRC